jgi:hypothetical protein
MLLVFFAALSSCFGWVTKTEALLCLIFCVLAYVLRVLAEILEIFKNKKS